MLNSVQMWTSPDALAIVSSPTNLVQFALTPVQAGSPHGTLLMALKTFLTVAKTCKVRMDVLEQTQHLSPVCRSFFSFTPANPARALPPVSCRLARGRAIPGLRLFGRRCCLPSRSSCHPCTSCGPQPWHPNC